MKISSRISKPAQFFCITMLALVTLAVVEQSIAFAAPTCTMRSTACLTGETAVIRLSSSTNAHAEFANQSSSGYNSNILCCDGTATFSTSCFNASSTLMWLSSTTNGHASISQNSGHANRVCLSSQAARVTVSHAATCVSPAVAVLSLSGGANSHIGTSTAYSSKVCVAEVPLTLSINITSSDLKFGDLSPGAIQFADEIEGTTTEVSYLSILTGSNSTSPYVVSILGQTLTNTSSSSIKIPAKSPIGNMAAGTSAFGIRFLNQNFGGNASSSLIGPWSTTSQFYFQESTTTPIDIYQAVSTDGNLAFNNLMAFLNATVSAGQLGGYYQTSLTFLVTPSY